MRSYLDDFFLPRTVIGKINKKKDECKEKIVRKEKRLLSIQPKAMAKITDVIADAVAFGVDVRLAGKQMSSRFDCWHTSFELAAKDDPAARLAAVVIKAHLDASERAIAEARARIEYHKDRLAWFEEELWQAWKREEGVLAEKLLARVAETERRAAAAKMRAAAAKRRAAAAKRLRVESMSNRTWASIEAHLRRLRPPGGRHP